ncbi:MAG: gamma-glutamyltransferase [Alphaproteobacteria bacterium]|nr:gamma-glutamyltransferase [Alphaproteobacteria bacterium]
MTHRLTLRFGALLATLSFALAPFASQTANAAVPAPVGATHGMVVSAHHLASDAGVAVLKEGGNAVDAAIAVAYALAVTFPEAGNLGGGGFMTVRWHDGREAFIDFRETAPGAATARLFQDASGHVIPGLSTRGYLAVGVPGTVAGLEMARARFGTLPRARLMREAIALARDGFVLDQGDADFLAEGAADFAKDPASAAIFLDHGAPWRPGERLVQTDLAATLQAIADDGADAFYRGATMRRIVAASEAHGGILSPADFAAYRAVVRSPLDCDYRGFHIISAPPPSSGGVVVCEALAILQGYPLSQMGFHSAAEVHVLTEALRRAFHDRNLDLGDPAFVHPDIAALISPAYAAHLRAGIDPDRATPSLSLGGVGASPEGQNTTHFSIVDKDGNAVSLTYTLNDWFGARVMAPGTGVLLNDEMDDFSSKPGVPNQFGLVEGTNNAIAPGKRPLSSMTPTIVTRNGALVLVVGTPGGSHIPTAVLQVLLNLIDHGMTLTEAVDAPRIHEQWLPDTLYYEPYALSPDTMALLRAEGDRLTPMGYENQVAAILVGAPALGAKPVGAETLYGAIDPRLPTGSVAGW